MSSKKSQLKTGIILSYINMVAGNLIPVFYTPVMLSILGQNEYGLYKLSSGITSYLGLLSMGLGSAITRYLIKADTEADKAAEEKILGLFMTIFHFVAVLTLIVGTLLTSGLHIWYGASLSDNELTRMQIIVFLMVCHTAVTFTAAPYTSVVSSHERFVFLQSMNIVTTCLAPMLNIVVLFLGWASVGMTIVSLIVSLFSRTAYTLYVHRSLKIKAQYRQMPAYLIKEILVFSFWIFVANIVNQLYNSTDTLMIGAIPELATAGVAVYNIGAVFNGMVFNCTTVVSGLMTPKTNKMVFSGADGRELTDLAIRVGRVQGFVITLLVTGFIAFGQPFISFYVGDGYSDAYWAAIFMMIPSMIPLVQSVCLSIIVAQNKHRFRSLVYLGIAILNVIGTWFLMKKWGVIGAAFMTGLATVLGQGFVMNWYYRARTGLEIGRFWRTLSKLYIIPILLCAGTLILSRWIDFYNIIFFVMGIVIYTIIYFVFSWLFVMNDYEKGLILNLLKRKRRSI